MAKYYVSREPNRKAEHEVHRDDCFLKPSTENCIYLGDFSTCHLAVKAALQHYSRINGCASCSPICHKVRQSGQPFGPGRR